MGILDATFDAIGGALQDQWKDVVTAGTFNEHTIVAPGVRKRSQGGRGNNLGSEDILSNGSIVYVPENTAAFIFSQGGIEEVILEPGGYEYRNGEASFLDERDRHEKGFGRIMLDTVGERIVYAGMSPKEKRVAFVNLREIRGIRFGTRGPLAYNDLFYGTDLEIYSYGTLSVEVVNPVVFVRNFLPPNKSRYSLDDPTARSQLIAEFLSSFISAVNGLSSEYRISQLPSQAKAICQAVRSEEDNVGTWPDRFGLKLMSVAIENIEFSEESRELVRQYSQKKMNVTAYEGVSQQAANVAAQQLIAEGVRENGFGDAGGMLFGMNLAGALNAQNAASVPGFGAAQAAVPVVTQGSAQAAAPSAAAPAATAAPPKQSIDEQIESLKKLKELLDAGILSQEEFDAKKHEVIGL